MDYEGNTLANTGEVKELEARVALLESEVTALQTQADGLQAQVDVKNQYFAWNDPSGTGALFFEQFTPPYFGSDVITECAVVNTNFEGSPEIIMGGPSGPNPVMAFRWEFYGTILQPYANPPLVTLAFFIGAGSITGAYTNNLSDDTPRGVPQIVAETPCRVVITLQIKYIAPDQFGVFAQTERSWDTPNIPTQITQSLSNRGWNTRIDFRSYIRFTSSATSGFQFKLLAFQFRRLI